MRKIIIGLVLLILISGVAYLSYQHMTEDRFACSYPPFTNIKNGMTADEAIDELGQPDQKVVKDELGGNRFDQGDLEQQIKSGWLYDLPDWDGGLEIYFNTAEIVVGKNCGNG